MVLELSCRGQQISTTNGLSPPPPEPNPGRAQPSLPCPLGAVLLGCEPTLEPETWRHLVPAGSATGRGHRRGLEAAGRGWPHLPTPAGGPGAVLTATTQPQEGPQAAGWALCPPGLTGQPCFTVTSSHPSGIHRLLPAPASPPSHLRVAGRGSAPSHKAQASLCCSPVTFPLALSSLVWVRGHGQQPALLATLIFSVSLSPRLQSAQTAPAASGSASRPPSPFSPPPSPPRACESCSTSRCNSSLVSSEQPPLTLLSLSRLCSFPVPTDAIRAPGILCCPHVLIAAMPPWKSGAPSRDQVSSTSSSES